MTIQDAINTYDISLLWEFVKSAEGKHVGIRMNVRLGYTNGAGWSPQYRVHRWANMYGQRVVIGDGIYNQEMAEQIYSQWVDEDGNIVEYTDVLP